LVLVEVLVGVWLEEWVGVVLVIFLFLLLWLLHCFLVCFHKAKISLFLCDCVLVHVGLVLVLTFTKECMFTSNIFPIHWHKWFFCWGRLGLERKTPPQGYVCHRCKIPGL
jgi:hypothetical protein